MLGILLLYNNFDRWPCQAIQGNHWEVECCTVILILSSNKTIRILTQIVTQKGVDDDDDDDDDDDNNDDDDELFLWYG